MSHAETVRPLPNLWILPYTNTHAQEAIDFITPYLIAVNVWVNILCYTMGIVDIDPVEVLYIGNRFKYCVFLEQRANIIKPQWMQKKA